MDSPDNMPDLEDPVISDGFQDHFDMGSPISVCDQVSVLQNFSRASDGTSLIIVSRVMQGKILIKPKRKRRPKVDQGIVNMPHDASSWGIGSSRLNGHQGGGRFEKQTLYRKFASFSSPYDKKKAALILAWKKSTSTKGQGQFSSTVKMLPKALKMLKTLNHMIQEITGMMKERWRSRS